MEKNPYNLAIGRLCGKFFDIIQGIYGAVLSISPH
jgi:hypothetical protein